MQTFLRGDGLHAPTATNGGRAQQTSVNWLQRVQTLPTLQGGAASSVALIAPCNGVRGVREAQKCNALLVVGPSVRLGVAVHVYACLGGRVLYAATSEATQL